MNTIAEHDIAERVRRSLTTRGAQGDLHVVEDGIRQDEDWWYVPVWRRAETPRGDNYYDLLSDVEEELRDQEGLNVTLVPTSNIIKLVPLRTSLAAMHVTADDWERLCESAGINSLKESYDRGECQRVAEAIRQNPRVLAFDPPSYSDEVVHFFAHCDGVQLR